MWILTKNGSHYVGSNAVIRIENNKIVVYAAQGLTADIIKNPTSPGVLENYFSRIQDGLRAGVRLVDFSNGTDYSM